MTSPISATAPRAARENSLPGRRLPWSARLFTRLSRRGLPPPVCGVRVAPGIEVPAADGVPLRTDHYIPQLTGPRPAVLVRTPYGRGFPWAFLFGGLFAERVYHVIIQSCRGTGGSGGTLDPWRHEVADGQATVAWLREQEWFTGELATIGPSYLGYTQWALAADPPPELRAMIVQVGASAPYPLFVPGWRVRAGEHADRRRGHALLLGTWTRRGAPRPAAIAGPDPAGHPDPAGARQHTSKATGGRIGYFDEWLTHPDAADPYWTFARRRGRPPPRRAPVPVSLLTGWQDDLPGPEPGRIPAAAGRGPHPTAWSSARGRIPRASTATTCRSWHRRGTGLADRVLQQGPGRLGEAAGAGARRWRPWWKWRDLLGLAAAAGGRSRSSSGGWPPAARPFQHRAAGPAAGACRRFRYDPADPTPVGGRAVAQQQGRVRWTTRPWRPGPTCWSFTGAARWPRTSR